MTVLMYGQKPYPVCIASVYIALESLWLLSGRNRRFSYLNPRKVFSVTCLVGKEPEWGMRGILTKKKYMFFTFEMLCLYVTVSQKSAY